MLPLMHFSSQRVLLPLLGHPAARLLNRVFIVKEAWLPFPAKNVLELFIYGNW